MSRRKRRSTGTIDRLPEELRDVVDQMLLARCTYREIVSFLAENEVTLSQMAVCRYADRYLATVEELRAAQENMRMMMDEIDKHPNLDTAEAILRLASNKVFNALTSVKDDDLESVPAEKLLKESVAIIRAAGYKKRIDQQNKTELETALDANQTLLADVLAKKHPELYGQVMDVIRAEKQKEESP